MSLHILRQRPKPISLLPSFDSLDLLRSMTPLAADCSYLPSVPSLLYENKMKSSCIKSTSETFTRQNALKFRNQYPCHPLLDGTDLRDRSVHDQVGHVEIAEDA